MQCLIDIFENNDDAWAIDKYVRSDYVSVAKEYGYIFGSSRTKREVERFLIDEMIKLISGTDITIAELAGVVNHLHLKNAVSTRQECAHALFFIRAIRFCTQAQPSYTASEQSWQKARVLLQTYHSLSDVLLGYIFPSNSNDLIAKSIIYLKGKGYKSNIIQGKVVFMPEFEVKILNRLQRDFRKLGALGLETVIQEMSLRHYDNEKQRFLLRPEPSVGQQLSLDRPWGYLFNLALANLHRPRSIKNKFETYSESVELARHYFGTKRLQSFTKFEDMHHTPQTILAAITRQIEYDQQFSIDQIAVKHMKKIMFGIFTSPKLSGVNVDLSLYLDIFEWASSRATHDKPLIFDVDIVFEALKHKYLQSSIKFALEKLSFSTSQINKGYLWPGHISLRNYYERPFVSVEQRYAYPNPNLCSYGFYSTLLELCKENGLNGKLIGDVTEELLGNALRDAGIKFLENKKYKISRGVRDELQINSAERECDFIVETESTVIFIELKRKTLTSDARAGSPLHSMIDIAQSLLHAQAQAGCHEYMLRRNGEIRYLDGSKIELKDRQVERVAVSMFGYFGVQDGFFVSQILNNLINGQIESENAEADEKINVHLREINRQFKTDEFREAYKDIRDQFIGSRFFSIPQILEILSNSSNNEEFEAELNYTKRSGTSCKDWFVDYHFLRGLRKPDIDKAKVAT